MIQCEGCQRHLLRDGPCPFCHRPARRGSALGMMVMAAVTPMVLAACYGSPVKETGPVDSGVTDLDGDGYFTPDDCDDTNELVNPGATEICGDGVDNDCDELIDDADDCEPPDTGDTGP